MFEFRVETTGTTGKNNFIKVRGLTRPRFFCVDIIRRMARAGSPVHKRKVVSKKLFPKSKDSAVNYLRFAKMRILCGKSYEVRGRRDEGEG